jgi:succinate dehydrogenase/fumarate reductase-like Fe-S protein
MKDLIVSIRRFDPDKDKEPYFQTYTVKVKKAVFQDLHV